MHFAVKGLIALSVPLKTANLRHFHALVRNRVCSEHKKGFVVQGYVHTRSNLFGPGMKLV